jgi:transposase
MAQPEVNSSQLEHGEEVCGVLFVARGEPPEVLDAIEEPLDAIQLPELGSLMGWTAPDPTASPCAKVVLSITRGKGAVPMQVSTVGLDIAKNVFQVHGVDDHGRTVLRRKVRRDQLLKLFGGLEPCLVGMEACATAHHWARELGALGRAVRLMPPAYVKACVKRNKNDAADAEAICEAVTRPTMRFVPIKSAEAQSVLMLHRARHLLVRQRTAQVSAMRAHLAEYGIVAAKGISRLHDLLAVLGAGAGNVPELARHTLLLIAQLIEALTIKIREIETELLAWHRTNTVSQRLETIPGVGFITATALAATARDARAFQSGRQLAAWLGLVPRQNSSGGSLSVMGLAGFDQGSPNRAAIHKKLTDGSFYNQIWSIYDAPLPLLS